MLLKPHKFPNQVRWSVEELREACVELYGGRWRKALAEDTGYTLAAVNSWADKKHPVPFVVRKYLRLQVQIKAALTQSPKIPYSVD